MVSRNSRRGLVAFVIIVLLLIVFFVSLKPLGITGGAIITLNPKDEGAGTNASFVGGGGLSNDATYSGKTYGDGNYGK